MSKEGPVIVLDLSGIRCCVSIERADNGSFEVQNVIGGYMGQCHTHGSVEGLVKWIEGAEGWHLYVDKATRKALRKWPAIVARLEPEGAPVGNSELDRPVANR